MDQWDQNGEQRLGVSGHSGQRAARKEVLRDAVALAALPALAPPLARTRASKEQETAHDGVQGLEDSIETPGGWRTALQA
jgi:hypothetical protein